MTTEAEKKVIAEEKAAEKVHQDGLTKAAEAQAAADVARASVPAPTTPAEVLEQGRADAARVRTEAEARALGATPYSPPGTPRRSSHKTNELAAVQDLIKEVGLGNLSNEEIVVRLKRIELSIQTF